MSGNSKSGTTIVCVCTGFSPLFMYTHIEPQSTFALRQDVYFRYRKQISMPSLTVANLIDRNHPTNDYNLNLTSLRKMPYLSCDLYLANGLIFVVNSIKLKIYIHRIS